MSYATVEAGEQCRGLGRDDGSFEVGASELADGFEGMPGGFDEDFNFASKVTERNVGCEIAGDAAEFRQNIFGKMFEVFWQLRFSGAGGPAAQDDSGSWNGGRGERLIADDDVPGADFPFRGETVEDVGIFAGEGFDFASFIHVKYEQSAVDGFGERAAKDKFAALAGFAGQAQVFFAERRAAIDHVVDEFVEQGVVVHGVHLLLR